MCPEDREQKMFIVPTEEKMKKRWFLKEKKGGVVHRIDRQTHVFYRLFVA